MFGPTGLFANLKAHSLAIWTMVFGKYIRLRPCCFANLGIAIADNIAKKTRKKRNILNIQF